MSDRWYPKNRGKVRGWPRRLRHIERLRERYAHPDGRMLDDYGYATVGLHLAPWGNLIPRNPPVWLRRRYVSVLLDLQRSWHGDLTERGEPFDLMLWLVHPRFWRTQLVAAVGDRVEFYRGTFLEPQPSVPPRPPVLYDAHAYDLDRLVWTPGYDCDYVMQVDLDSDPSWAAWFEKRARHRVVHEAHGMYTYRQGSAWIGRLPGTTPR